MMRTSSDFHPRLTRLLACVVAGVLALGACKGETVIKPDPQTLADLEACRKAKDEKDKLVKAVEEDNARLMRKQGGGEPIVVTIEGNILNVKPGKPGEVRPLDDKAASAAALEFIDVVSKSKGEIQKCYERALKQNAGLQSKIVKLMVSATFSQGGAVEESSFSPSLGGDFDRCIKGVASRWALSNISATRTFVAPVALTPS